MSSTPKKTVKKSVDPAIAGTAGLEARLEALRAEMDEIKAVLAAASPADEPAEPAEVAADLVGEEILKEARQALKQIRRQTASLEKTLGVETRTHPLQSLAIAFGAGFLVSLIMRR